jgi:hypothetical protein
MENTAQSDEKHNLTNSLISFQILAKSRNSWIDHCHKQCLPNNWKMVAGNKYVLWKFHDDSLCPSIALTSTLNQEKTLDVLASSCQFLLVSWVPTTVIKTCLDHWTCQFLKRYITAMKYCKNTKFLSST